MRFSRWSTRAPRKESLTAKVEAVIQPVLADLAGEPDPDCWIVWGDDPAARYTVLALSAAGLVLVAVRVNVPQEGPRTSGKLIRWNRVQTGELALEMAAGHRLISFQLEGHVIRGSDADADEISAFALDVFAAMDGRPRVASTGTRAASGGARAGAKTPRTAATAAAKAPAKPGAASAAKATRPAAAKSPRR